MMIAAFLAGAGVLGLGVLIGASITQSNVNRILDINNEKKDSNGS